MCAEMRRRMSLFSRRRFGVDPGKSPARARYPLLQKYAGRLVYKSTRSAAIPGCGSGSPSSSAAAGCRRASRWTWTHGSPSATVALQHRLRRIVKGHLVPAIEEVGDLRRVQILQHEVPELDVTQSLGLITTTRDVRMKGGWETAAERWMSSMTSP